MKTASLENGKVGAEPHFSAESAILGDSESFRRLRTQENNYGHMYERYESLLFGDDCLENVQKFSDDTLDLLNNQQDNPALQLAVLTSCLDLSQAAIRVSQGWDTRFPETALSEFNLASAVDDIRKIVDGVAPDTALVGIVKDKISWIFDTYKTHPLLEVDVPAREYETDVLGAVALLPRAVVTGEARDYDHTHLDGVESQPTQLAKGMLGFRDVSDRISLVAPIDQEDIERRARYSLKEYLNLDRGMQYYMSGYHDYEQVVDIMNRRIVIDGAEPFDTVFDSDKVDTRLFQEAHRPIVRSIIENSIGLPLKDVPLDTQFEFLRFCTHNTLEEYERLGRVMQNTPEARRVTLFESFMATEFGDDFGDILLELAESDDDDMWQLLEGIRRVRESNYVIADKIKSEDPFDQAIANRLPAGFAKRITEQLALARQDGVSGGFETMQAVVDASEQIAQGLSSDNFKVVDADSSFGAFGAEGTPLTITARPYGYNARLGFTVRGMGEDGKQRLNIRLDYEDGKLSLDIGSIARKGVNSSEIARKVGADLARGELALKKYRAEKHIDSGSADTYEMVLHGNHVRETFEDLPYIYPEEFAGFVNRFMYRLNLSGQLVDPTEPKIVA